MRRFLLLRTELDRILTASMFFSCILVGIRMLHTGRLTFLSMIWNLFLAYIPYAISSGLWQSGQSSRQSGQSLKQSGQSALHPGSQPASQSAQSSLLPGKLVSLKKFLRALAFLAWLLFIPNSFYILTDLYHLADGHRNSRVPEWFDLALILSFAWNGLLLGVLSTRHIEKLMAPKATALGRWLFLYPVMWLNALGVYIGRYLRYNSWDIITNPFDLLTDILRMILHPFRHHYAWDMIFCYSVLLTLIYILIVKGGKALS
jgi:uncharacterized membrane protein